MCSQADANIFKPLRDLGGDQCHTYQCHICFPLVVIPVGVRVNLTLWNEPRFRARMGVGEWTIVAFCGRYFGFFCCTAAAVGVN